MTADPTSLKAELHRRILHDMVSTHTAGGRENVVLVVDPRASKILSSCARVYDVMDAGVLALENLYRERESLLMPAIYFIEPSRVSVERVAKDFAEKPQYSRVHLYFTGRCPDELMDLLAGSPLLLDRLDVVSELECDFVAAESRLFNFARKRALRPLLGLVRDRPDDRLDDELAATARQLSSVCITLHEYPMIRWEAGSPRAARLAALFERDLNERLTRLPKWEATAGRERGTLLIVDRTLDPVAPLMHELTYQAMAVDTLTVRGEMVSVRNDKKEYVIGEEDSEWIRYRHSHIHTAKEGILRSFAEFRKQNAMAQLRSKGNDATLKEMIKAMKSLPQYESLIKSMEKHMTLVVACFDELDAQKIEPLADLEQDIVTGVNDNGDRVKQSQLRDRLARVVADKAVSTENKMRLLMAYMVAQGDLGASRRQLLDSSGVTLKQARALTNLRALGVDIAKQARPSDPRREAEFKERARSAPLLLMRFVPALRAVLDQLAADTLSRDEFPYTKEPPPKLEVSASGAPSSVGGASAASEVGAVSVRRNKRNNWRDRGKEDTPAAESKEQEAAPPSGPRLITYVLGGVAASEVRSAYEVAAERRAHMYIGSTELLSASAYLDALQGDDLPEDDPDDDLSDSDDGGAGLESVRVDRLG